VNAPNSHGFRALIAAVTLAPGALTAQRPGAPRVVDERPLAAVAGVPVIVLPVRGLVGQDATGWGAKIGPAREYLAKVDDEIAFALGERGVGSMWVFAPRLARSARRNPGYAVDPYAVAVEPIRITERKPDEPLGDPAASQLRSLCALHDARYALVPVQLSFETVPGGTRAVLHVVLIDTRAARIRMVRDLVSDPVASFTPALAAGVASRLADLIAAP
jgi:hypothetical protein